MRNRALTQHVASWLGHLPPCGCGLWCLLAHHLPWQDASHCAPGASAGQLLPHLHGPCLLRTSPVSWVAPSGQGGHIDSPTDLQSPSCLRAKALAPAALLEPLIRYQAPLPGEGRWAGVEGRAVWSSASRQPHWKAVWASRPRQACNGCHGSVASMQTAVALVLRQRPSHTRALCGLPQGSTLAGSLCEDCGHLPGYSCSGH